MNSKIPGNVTSCELYVKGMHCPSCEILIESSLKEHEKVKYAKASLNNNRVTIHLIDTNVEHILKDLNNLVKDFGYTLSDKSIQENKLNIRQLLIAFIIAALLTALFFLLQKSKIITLANSNQVTYPFVFLIGIIASLSSCMAVVGGLVLSISSTYAKTDRKFGYLAIQIFHVSRIISFFLLGGLIGLLGSAFTLTPTSSFILNTVLFIVMIILGINLLDIFPSFRKFQLKMPKSINTKFANIAIKNKYIMPALIGTSTFFLPCGFTQSMQIFSLTTGNFISGALTMLVFSLGTLPVLALISFASFKFSRSLQSHLLFKTAGFIVLFFAIFNFLNALIAIGLIRPIFNS